MQKTVTNTNDKKSLISSFLEVLEVREQKAEADRQLQEEKYLRRTQRIYELHDCQRREASELRRCLEYVSQHAHVLETVLRGAGTTSNGTECVPLSAALVRQAATLQRCMSQCVANASRIRQLLTATHQPQMDNVLAKMEAELNAWTSFLNRAVDATYNTEVVIDNLQNMLAEQRRCVREVTSSSVYLALCGAESEEISPVSGQEAAARVEHLNEQSSDPARRQTPSASGSTPIDRN